MEKKLALRPHQVRPFLRLLDGNDYIYEQGSRYGELVLERLRDMVRIVGAEPGTLIHLTLKNSTVCGGDCKNKSARCDVGDSAVSMIELRYVYEMLGQFAIPMRGFTVEDLRKMDSKLTTVYDRLG